MSSTPPPPPPGLPPDPQAGPPAGPPPEYLDSGSGRPVQPGAGGRGLRRGLLVGGGVLGVAAVGVGAWAAVSFFSTGPQPAQALPADTLAYLSVDLDPSGGQKIEALRTLNKFPAFEDEFGLDADDDLREAIFEEVVRGLDCADLDYADDVEPWLGDRGAVAAVDAGEEQPSPVVVLQVRDAEAAREGITGIAECGGTQVGLAVDGDWAVLAETDEIAERVADEAGEASLADDDDFQRWTGEAGDAGVMAMYAGPALGDYLADNADELLGFPFGAMGGVDMDCLAQPDLDGTEAEACLPTNPDAPADGSALSDDMSQRMEDFAGMAGVVRFDDGAVELELAGDAALAGDSLLAGDGAGEALAGLPADTAVAFGMGFADGWLRDLLEVYAPSLGGSDVDGMLEELEAETGLVLPDDVEALLGDSAVLAVAEGTDLSSFMFGDEGSDAPVALKVDGDPDEVERVLDTLRAQLPPGEPDPFGRFLDSSTDGDTVVIGPSEAYRERLLEEGGLGDEEVFEDVVREADDAAVVLFVNVDLIQRAFAEDEAVGADGDVLANLEPISGVGVSAWADDDVAHSVLRLTTD